MGSRLGSDFGSGWEGVDMDGGVYEGRRMFGGAELSIARYARLQHYLVNPSSFFKTSTNHSLCRPYCL